MSSGGCVPFATPGVIWKVPGMLLDRAGPLSLHPMYLPAIAPWLIRMLWYSRRGEVERISAALASLLTRAQAAYQDLLEVEEYSRMIQARGLLFPYKSEAAFRAGGFARDLRQKHGL